MKVNPLLIGDRSIDCLTLFIFYIQSISENIYGKLGVKKHKMNKKDTKRYLIMLIFFALVSALAFTEGIRRLTEQMPPDISASPLLIGVCTSIILSGPATMTLMLWDVFNFNYDAFPAMWAIRHVLMATLIFICTVINLEKDFTTALSINFILNAAVISGSDVYCHGLEKPVNLKT